MLQRRSIFVYERCVRQEMVVYSYPMGGLGRIFLEICAPSVATKNMDKKAMYGQALRALRFPPSL